MSRAAGGRPGRTKQAMFGGLFVVIVLLAIFPPVYIWAGGQHQAVLGLPFSAFYLVLVGLLATVLCAALYVYEDARGEID